eukprot:1401132-Rhodomonas_salina.1
MARAVIRVCLDADADYAMRWLCDALTLCSVCCCVCWEQMKKKDQKLLRPNAPLLTTRKPLRTTVQISVRAGRVGA